MSIGEIGPSDIELSSQRGATLARALQGPTVFLGFVVAREGVGDRDPRTILDRVLFLRPLSPGVRCLAGG
jgi:hypothetical protein